MTKAKTTPANKLDTAALVAIWNENDPAMYEHYRRAVGNQLISRGILTVKDFYRNAKIAR
jgi:hypothetical protein